MTPSPPPMAGPAVTVVYRWTGTRYRKLADPTALGGGDVVVRLGPGWRVEVELVPADRVPEQRAPVEAQTAATAERGEPGTDLSREQERALLRQQRKLLAAGDPAALAIADAAAKLVEHALADRPTAEIVESNAAPLARELRVIRKGRGVHARMRPDRVGPIVRRVCGIAPYDRAPVRAEKITDWLRDRIALLPSDVRLCALAAFGLEHEAEGPFYQDRVQWVAAQLERDPRTARRRIDEAINWVAAIAVHGAKAAGNTIALRDFVDQEVRVTRTTCGGGTVDMAVHVGAVVAVARVVDDQDRHVLVVRCVDEPTPIAIPTTRIRQVERADELWPRTADLHGW